MAVLNSPLITGVRMMAKSKNAGKADKGKPEEKNHRPRRSIRRTKRTRND